MAKKPEAPAPGIEPDAVYVVTFKERGDNGPAVKFIPGREYRVRGRVLTGVLGKVADYKIAD